MTFSIGSLVRARNREWVILPESSTELFHLRPLGGSDAEVTMIHTGLETIEPARFDPPVASFPGDYKSCRLLRDSVRLGFRSSTGPFRSFAQVSVEPRPYQLVPLLMALKLDPIRLLVADDVGIGKTIEACLVAREMLDRGEVSRLAVLCPPHLAEQWKLELENKFHVSPELVLPSTAGSLERQCRLGQSLFDLYPHVVVSFDFIKTDRRRDEFLRTCPELVIVDEAHTCASSGERGSGRHQRHQLIKGLSSDPNRHMVFVTATPHSGNEVAFQSLIALLDPSLAKMNEVVQDKERNLLRDKLAQRFVQRRRQNIRSYMDTDTPFPSRQDKETSYKLTPEYAKFFDKVLNYARETVISSTGEVRHQRVRWWSALALLRCLASSPTAAAATLRSRAATLDTETTEEADEIGQRTVLDLSDIDSAEGTDTTPGSDSYDDSDSGAKERSRLLAMAREAEALAGLKDAKLLGLVKVVEELLKDGFRPIVFCRYIATAEYVASALRDKFSKVSIGAVTGLQPPDDRKKAVLDLAESAQHILVCTDCLSEGINLQEHFDAVVHYDLSWNPTRHEQREGRVDRYGQAKKNVRVLTYYGIDNQIDGIVLDVLIRKHKTIRNSLGISVPVPVDSEQVIEAVFKGLLLRERSTRSVDQMGLFDSETSSIVDDIHAKWDDAVELERKRTQSRFAQESIKVEDVARELKEVRAVIGSGANVEEFVRESLIAHKALVTGNGKVTIDLKECPRALKDSLMTSASLGSSTKLTARFELPIEEGEIYLSRTHPFVEALANYVLDTALDAQSESVAHRCGVIRTNAVERRTTLLLIRCRYQIHTKANEEERSMMAEECQLVAFAGSPQTPEWLPTEHAEKLMTYAPNANIAADEATHFLRPVIENIEMLLPHLEEVAQERGKVLLESHERVHQAAKVKGIKHRVEPQLPPDVLGVYIYLPAS